LFLAFEEVRRRASVLVRLSIKLSVEVLPEDCGDSDDCVGYF
ncbi:hypothetical protein Tco_0651354, partial [Tanacetum coccineum]